MASTALIERAAALIQQADALVIAAGAGLGVDSGLPDFRGKDGFWKAYPALRDVQIDFYNIASPSAFHSEPDRAWGFMATAWRCTETSRRLCTSVAIFLRTDRRLPC